MCVCVFLLTRNLFCLHAKSRFHFQAHHQFCGFFATLAVSFFLFFLVNTLTVPDLVTWKYFFISFSFLMVLFFYYICLSRFLLYPLHNWWCGHFADQLSCCYWRLSSSLELSLSLLFFHQPSAASVFRTQILEALRHFGWKDFPDSDGWHCVILLLLNCIGKLRVLWQFCSRCASSKIKCALIQEVV